MGWFCAKCGYPAEAGSVCCAECGTDTRQGARCRSRTEFRKLHYLLGRPTARVSAAVWLMLLLASSDIIPPWPLVLIIWVTLGLHGVHALWCVLLLRSRYGLFVLRWGYAVRVHAAAVASMAIIQSGMTAAPGVLCDLPRLYGLATLADRSAPAPAWVTSGGRQLPITSVTSTEWAIEYQLSDRLQLGVRNVLSTSTHMSPSARDKRTKVKRLFPGSPFWLHSTNM